MDFKNDEYKNKVGTAIFKYVEKLTTPELAPKYTGMLIDSANDSLKEMLQDWKIFFR